MNFIFLKMRKVISEQRKKRIARLSQSRSCVKLREEVRALPIPSPFLHQDPAFNAAMNRYMEDMQRPLKNPLFGELSYGHMTYAPVFSSTAQDNGMEIRRIVDVEVINDDEDEPPTSLQITSEVR